MHNKYGREGLAVLAVNAWDEPKSVVQKLSNDLKLSHRILLDGSAVARDKYNVVALPTTFWIHKDGNVVRQTSGGNGKEAKDTEAWIRGMIKAD